MKMKKKLEIKYYYYFRSIISLALSIVWLNVAVAWTYFIHIYLWAHTFPSSSQAPFIFWCWSVNSWPHKFPEQCFSLSPNCERFRSSGVICYKTCSPAAVKQDYCNSSGVQLQAASWLWSELNRIHTHLHHQFVFVGEVLSVYERTVCRFCCVQCVPTCWGANVSQQQCSDIRLQPFQETQAAGDELVCALCPAISA